MPQDITKFTDDDAPALAADETTEFELGGVTYKAAMPKQTPWLDAYQCWGEMEAASVAKKRLDDPTSGALSVHERARLQSLVDANPDIKRIIEVFVTGWDDPNTGRPHGGFFRWCVTPEDYQTIISLPYDRASSVDWTDIWNVALDLLLHFEEPMVQLAEESGLNITRVEPTSRRARRAAPAKKTASKPTVKKTTATRR